jgi:hypothetical protein
MVPNGSFCKCVDLRMSGIGVQLLGSGEPIEIGKFFTNLVYVIAFMKNYI